MNDITLERALENIRLYNQSLSYVSIDREALALFGGGLGRNHAEVERQLRFMADRHGYGAITWSKRRRVIPQDTPLIAAALLSQRREYLEALSAVPSPIQAVPEPAAISLLLEPFVQSERWLVWAAKTWHFLKPAALPILDSYASQTLEKLEGVRIQGLKGPVQKYCAFANALRTFVLPRQEWLAPMRSLDGTHYWSDWKLWDKVFFEEFKRHQKRRSASGAQCRNS